LGDGFGGLGHGIGCWDSAGCAPCGDRRPGGRGLNR
jgi:hypothetical protein